MRSKVVGVLVLRVAVYGSFVLIWLHHVIEALDLKLESWTERYVAYIKQLMGEIYDDR
jgi:hypothetical protein